MTRYDKLWKALDDAALISGAWHGLALREIPHEYRTAFVAAADAFAYASDDLAWCSEVSKACGNRRVTAVADVEHVVAAHVKYHLEGAA